MITASVPGWGDLSIEYLLIDFNGTAAYDGKFKERVPALLAEIAKQVKVIVVTADTYGTVEKEAAAAGLSVVKVNESDSGEDKARVVRELGPERVAAIGNGANDAAMFREAALGILVIGEEGCATSAFKEADVVVTDVVRALEMLVHPERLVATLRD
jgi:P-type E1-E2 ATPase